nr:adenylosuccinate lyase family protein [Desulfobulbaceae bacterium]
MPSHPIDFTIQSLVFSTKESALIFDEQTRFSRWLSFEAALASSQAELNIIPQQAADTICKNARLESLDINQIALEYTTNRNSLVPVLKVLRKACGKYGDYVHFGATTQDVLDTCLILEIKDSLSLAYRDLRTIEDALLRLAKEHRLTPMIGRTHSQQAMPITFGLKVSIWLAELRRHIERLKSVAHRVLCGQLSGAVGTMAALGDKGLETSERTMAKLGLASSALPWHTSRDNIAETCGVFSMITATACKIANEVFQLGKTEILELREPSAAGKSAGSSTMPHKRNPVLCERVAVLATHVRALAQITQESMIHENERDPRSLWAEWLAVPQISIYTATALNYLKQITANLEVFPDRMLSNIHLHKDSILSEWLLFKISSVTGKTKALELINDFSVESKQSGRATKELIAAHKDLAPHFSPEDLLMFDCPERYIGLAPEIVDVTIRDIEKKRAQDPLKLDKLAKS